MSRERHDHEIQLTDEQQQHRSAVAVAATRLAEQDAQFKTELASIAGIRDSLEQQLQGVEAKLTQQIESRAAIEQALTDLRSTAAAAEQRFRGEIDAITESARTEQARLEEQMSRERHDHELQLTDEQEQHRSAMAIAATRLAEREAKFATELASIAGIRDSLKQQLQAVEAKLTQETESRTALEQALTDLRSTAAAAEQRFRGEIDAITESARTEQARLEEQMSRERHDHAIQLTNEQEQHRSALAVAATRLAGREAQFKSELASIAGSRDGLERQLQEVEARLAQETESRTALEQALTDLRSAATAAEQRFRGEIDGITESARIEQARLEAQISRERLRSSTLSADGTEA
jgi:predicted  nucleic acid-binding Zn-ribbon protein